MNKACKVFTTRYASLEAYALAAIEVLLEYYKDSNVINISKIQQATDKICGEPVGELARTVARALSVVLEELGIPSLNGYRKVFERKELERARALLILRALQSQTSLA